MLAIQCDPCLNLRPFYLPQDFFQKTQLLAVDSPISFPYFSFARLEPNFIHLRPPPFFDLKFFRNIM